MTESFDLMPVMKFHINNKEKISNLSVPLSGPQQFDRSQSSTFNNQGGGNYNTLPGQYANQGRKSPYMAKPGEAASQDPSHVSVS